MVFMDTAATIPTGAMAERLKFTGFVLMGFWVSMVIYPLVGGWVWGGGWLANLGRTAGLGNGAVDFAGSGVVHMIGGAVALAGAIAIGPRIGRFNPDGTANAMPGHNIPMGVLGTIILFFGWFGFNPGSSLAFVGTGQNLASNAAVNTLLAGGAGGFRRMLLHVVVRPDEEAGPGPLRQRRPGGAGGHHLTLRVRQQHRARCAIGLIAGVIVCLASFLLEKLHIDDPVGAVPVHFFNGIWGLLSVGIFADGAASSAGWNGVDGPVTGLLFGGKTQILAQLLRGRRDLRGGRRTLVPLLQAPERAEAPAQRAGARADGPGHAGDGRTGLLDGRRAHAWQRAASRQSPRLGRPVTGDGQGKESSNDQENRSDHPGGGAGPGEGRTA